MDDPPVILPCERIFVFLAQKANVIGFLELGDVGGVGAELCVIELDGTDVLVPAMNQLLLFVSLDFDSHLRCCNCKSHKDKGHHEEQPHQKIASLSRAAGLRIGEWGRRHGHLTALVLY